MRLMEDTQQITDGSACVEIEIPGRFVSEQQLGLPDESPGDGHSLLLSAGEFARAMLDTLSHANVR